MRKFRKKMTKESVIKFDLVNTENIILNGQDVKLESELEINYSYILEFEKEIKFFFEKSFKVFFSEQENDFFQPSFCVEYRDGKKEIILVLHTDEIDYNIDRALDKIELTKLICKKNNFSYKQITQIDIDTPKGWNCKFLHYYRCPVHEINSFEISWIWDKIKTIQKTTPREIIEIMANDKYKQAEFLYMLWHLISIYIIKFDINEKLSMNSQIWYNDEL